MQTFLVKSTSMNQTLVDSVYKPLTINLAFEPLLIDLGPNFDSSKDVSIKVWRVENTGTWVKDGEKVSMYLKPEPNFESAVRVCLSDGAKLEEGEMYKFTISYTAKPDLHQEIKTVSETSYFAVNYQLNSADLSFPALHSDRKVVVCISDIHLGQNKEYAEFNVNTNAFVEFLTKVNTSPNVREMVIAGDLIDGWIIPASEPAEAEDSETLFSVKVKEQNEAVFEALNKVCDNEQIKSTYVPGNHDLMIDEVQISAVLPNIYQARETDLNENIIGLGAYSPIDFPNAIIEHGHRYNFFCAPCLIDSNDHTKQSILPPGYFLTRIATEAFCNPASGSERDVISDLNILYGDEDIYNKSQYYAMCTSILKMLPVKHKTTDKFIQVGIDAMAASYAISDLLPSLPDNQESVLYNSIALNQNWKSRQIQNKVNVLISTFEAIMMSNSAAETDSMSNVQYFSNPHSQKNIVVFGHSHVPRINTYSTTGQNIGIYANTGTWIDNNNLGSTMTFVLLIPNKSDSSAPAFVNLYQYKVTGEIVLLDSQATYNFTKEHLHHKE